MNKWISVKHRLPENAKEILVSDGYRRYLAFFGISKHDDSLKSPSKFINHFIQSGTFLDITSLITHWMPLPELPYE